MKLKPIARMNIWRLLLLTTLTAQITPLAARAQSLDAAHTFTTALYRAYENNGEPDYTGRRARTTFAPHLLTLIRQDDATTPPGYVGALDWDPICDCQDADGLKVDGIKISQVAPGRANAVVALRFPSEAKSITLDLVVLRDRWWVADIRTGQTPSLVRLLERELKRMPAGRRSSR